MLSKNNLLRIVLMLGVVIASPVWANIVVSTFDSSDEGWTPFLNSGAVVQHPLTGGNPDGHIYVDDVTNDWGYLKAPPKFNKPALYNGSLSFDMQAYSNSATYPIEFNTRVVLVGTGLTLINESFLPTSSWLNYSFLLNETAGWRIATNMQQNYNPLDPVPTSSQVRGVLTNLTDLYIATDYSNGNLVVGTIDRTYLDNVRLELAPQAIPEPITITLFGVGLAILKFSRKRPLIRI